MELIRLIPGGPVMPLERAQEIYGKLTEAIEIDAAAVAELNSNIAYFPRSPGGVDMLKRLGLVEKKGYFTKAVPDVSAVTQAAVVRGATLMETELRPFEDIIKAHSA